MKEDFNKLDEAFRQRFEDFGQKPPDELWANIQSHIPQYKVHPLKAFYRNYPALSAFISGVFVVALLYFGHIIFNNTTDSTTIAENNQKNQAVNYAAETSTHTALKLNDNQNRVVNKDESTVKTEISIKNNQTAENTNVFTPKAANQTNVVALNNKQKVNIATENFVDLNKAEKQKYLSNSNNATPENLIGQSEFSGRTDEMNFRWMRMPSINYSYSSMQYPQMLSEIHSQLSQPPVDDYKRPEHSFALTAGYAPEWNYNLHQNPKITDIELSHHAELGIIYNKKYFFAQTGIGLSLMKDNTNVVFQYTSLDSVNYYLNVDSLTFQQVYNPITGQWELQPVYHYTPVVVYDSVLHTVTQPVTNHYTYLQLPLYAGFKNDFSRFTLFVKGGAVFNLMVLSKIQQAQKPNDNPTLIEIEDLSTQRLKTFTQLFFSFGATYRFTNRFSVYVEPCYRYYLNPVFSNTHAQLAGKPYAFSLRTGLIYEF